MISYGRNDGGPLEVERSTAGATSGDDLEAALWAFWDFYWNHAAVLDGSDVYSGKYSLIPNEDLVRLDALGEAVEMALTTREES